MSAEKNKNLSVPELAIIAGGGTLPSTLLEACEKKHIVPFIVAIDGQTDPGLVKGHYHLWTRLGEAGQVIRTLKSHDIKDIVMIGSIRRPSFEELRPDWQTARLIAKIGLKAWGDDGVLKALRSELEKQGFVIRGAQEFVDDLLTRTGQYGKHKPGKQAKVDILKGIEICKALGNLDVGQCCVIQNGIVLGVEAIEGTDALIRRCAPLKRKGPGPVLIKTSKAGQDKNLDLPTIGPETIKQADEAGFSGIAAEAQHSILLHADETTRKADKAGMFLIGIAMDEQGNVVEKSS